MTKKARPLKILSYPVIRHSLMITYQAFTLFLRVISKVKFSIIFPNASTGCCHWSCEIKYPENIELGQDVIIGKEVTIGAHAKIVIGNNVRLSKNVTIETASLDFKGSIPYKHVSKPIIVCDNVWVGNGAIILSGVTIGEGAIIGAGAIVTKSVPPRTIFVGQPGRVLPVNE